jgi:molybdopterin/thiamine biosynthesis adenylyltransferase/nitroreductase
MTNASLEKIINPIIKNSSTENLLFEPSVFRLKKNEDKENFSRILSNNDLKITDTIFQQLCELLLIRNSSKTFTPEELKKQVNDYVNEDSLFEYGVWVFYPWNKHVVHVLDKDEFLEVITNRNKQKITEKEQAALLQKKIGIIGMSVGQSIASAIAIENLCSEIRIGDFDTLELSNCNRINTSLYNLGLNKSVIAARSISEINPFIKIICFTEGVTEENIDAFFLDGGKLDLLIEECDNINMKLLARVAARKNRVPVIMETNDRGMIDIERYDLNENYPYLHGLFEGVNYDDLKQLTMQQKIGYILKIAGIFTTSARARASTVELGQTIRAFPQLASSVFLGGALCADTARRILLGTFKASGRFYIDLEEIISEKENKNTLFKPDTPSALTVDEMMQLANQARGNSSENISKELAEDIIRNAMQAPSSGNDQPWKWLYTNNSFYLFHEIKRSYSFGDYNNRASYISLGSAIENFVLAAVKNSYETQISFFPTNNERLISKIDLNPSAKEINGDNKLYENIFKRYTNRQILSKQIIPGEILDELTNAAKAIKNADVIWITDEKKLSIIGKIISACDRMRILQPHGHYDFFHREIRWSKEELLSARTGMGIDELNLSNENMIALKILSDEKVINVLNSFDGANALRYVSLESVNAASAMCLITMPDYSPESFLNGGRALQRQWLKATELSVAYHPMVGPLYFFPRIVFGNGETLTDVMKEELAQLRKDFLEIFPGDNFRGEIALVRVFIPDNEKPKSVRLNLNEVFVYKND